MARPTKKGVDYFPFDVGFFGDKNVRILKARYRADGIAVYVKILCDVYKEGYYLPVVDWDDYVFVIADEFGISTNAVEQIIKFLQSHAMVRVFNKKDELTGLDVDAVITSHGIQKRYAAAMKSRRKKSVDDIKRGFWLLTEDEEREINAFYKNGINDSFSEKNPDKSEKNPDESEKNDTKEKKKSTKSPIIKRTFSSTDGEQEKAKREFFNLYPQLLETSQGVDDTDIDYKKLLDAFARSKKCLQIRIFFSWVAANYLKIIEGKYDDFPEAKPRTNKSPSTQPTVSPAVQEADAKAERERFYSLRKNAAKDRAEANLNKALKLSSAFAQVYKDYRNLDIALAKAFISNPEELPTLQAKQETLLRARADALKQINMTEKDLEPQWHCSKCSDTGHLPNGRACDCYQKSKEKEK